MKHFTISAFAALSILSPSLYGQTDTTKTSFFDMDLEQLMNVQVAGRGQVGSFGFNISGYHDSRVWVNGYVTNEYLDALNSNSTFDNHYFNLFLGTDIDGLIYPEIQLEYEHGGEEIQARYAQVDIKLSDAFIVRTGKFLIPSGSFNEYLYPEYINKSIGRSFVNRHVAPSAWAEVGIQLRGSIDLGDVKPYYALYAVNGLQGEDGGDIRSMRNNHRDKTDDNKAYGGRLGFTLKGFEFGTSGYYGAYTEDGEQNLLIAGADIGYTASKWTFRTEYQMADMETADTTRSNIVRSGMYVQASYSLFERFEPVVRYDFMDWDDPNDETKDKSRVYFGVNYKINALANFKIGYEMITNKGEDVADDLLGFQLAVGF